MTVVPSRSGDAYELDDDPAFPRGGIEIEEDHLLPGPQSGVSPREGDGQRGAHESGAHVRVSVAIVPGLFVVVRVPSRNQTFEEFPEVLEQSGLVLHRREGSSGPDDEECRGPVLEAALLEDGPESGRDVHELEVWARGELDLTGEDRGRSRGPGEGVVEHDRGQASEDEKFSSSLSRA